MSAYLAIRTSLHKDLIVQVVVVHFGKDVNVAHDLQHIDALLESLTRQMHLGQAQAIFLLGQVSHLGVRLPVVQSNRGQIVECLVQVMFNVRYIEWIANQQSQQ
jgi:hypothetical protein